MKVLIKHITCGQDGELISCYAPTIFCPFCRNRNTSFTEVKEVTPKELYDLIDCFNKIIVSLYD